MKKFFLQYVMHVITENHKTLREIDIQANNVICFNMLVCNGPQW